MTDIAKALADKSDTFEKHFRKILPILMDIERHYIELKLKL